MFIGYFDETKRNITVEDQKSIVDSYINEHKINLDIVLSSSDFGSIDIRKGSPTFGKYVAVELSAENQRQLFIPRHFLHGFSVLSETAVFAYKCDNLYCKEAEFSIRYDDPEIGVDWKVPADQVMTSEKDCIARGLKDVY